MKYLLLLFFLLLLISLQAQDIISENEKFVLVEDQEIILKENIQFFNQSGGMALLDSTILVSAYNPPVIISYDMNGEQNGLVSDQGRGPHEFQMPTIISSNKKKFVIWDAVQLKFTEVNGQGEPGNEFIGIKQAIGKFAFTDSMFAIYNKGHMDGPLISTYQINGTRLNKLNDVDKMNEQHKKLTRYGHTAPFAIKGDTIYYGRADKTHLYKYNLRTGKRADILFTDSNFNVDKTNFSMNDRSEKADDEWINFIYTNSRLKNIYTLDSYVIAEVQNGNNFDKSRETVLHIFDYELNKLDEIKLGHTAMLNLGDGAKLSSGSELIFYKDYPDMTNRSGKYERGQEYAEVGKHYLRKLTFLKLIENKN